MNSPDEDLIKFGLDHDVWWVVADSSGSHLNVTNLSLRQGPSSLAPPATIITAIALTPAQFHVDNLSSAHVYVRLRDGETWDNIPEELLEDCAQLTKANSIEGQSPEPGQITFATMPSEI